jgi:hypothetical protein
MNISLRRVGLEDQAGEMLLEYRDWLAEVAPSLPVDAGPQENLHEAQRRLVDLLRAAGLNSDADELAEAATPAGPEP